FRHELAFGPFDDLVPEAPSSLVEQRLVAPDIAALEHGGADGQIAAAHADHIIERTARMADLEAEVPHEIENRLDHLFAPGGLLDRREESDIDVRMRRHFAAAVPAD